MYIRPPAEEGGGGARGAGGSEDEVTAVLGQVHTLRGSGAHQLPARGW